MAYKYQKLLDKLRQDEGFEPEPYRDHLGKLTVGIGWLLPPEEGGEPLPPGYEPPLTEEQGLELAQYKINQKVAGLARIDTFNTLDPVRQEILVECAYQIGVGGLAKFKKMWAALTKKDYKTAAMEMLDSKVAKEQTPARWEAHAKRMVGDFADLAKEAEEEQKPVPVEKLPMERVEGNVLGDEEYADESIGVEAENLYAMLQHLGLTRTNKDWDELTAETKMRWLLADRLHKKVGA